MLPSTLFAFIFYFTLSSHLGKNAKYMKTYSLFLGFKSLESWGTVEEANHLKNQSWRKILSVGVSPLPLPQLEERQ